MTSDNDLRDPSLSQEYIESYKPSSEKINFNAAEFPTTKGPVQTSEKLIDMVLFTYYTPAALGEQIYDSNQAPSDNNLAGKERNFMNNQKVTRTDASSPWTYSPIKYWPNNADDRLHFFAYAPFSAYKRITFPKIDISVLEFYNSDTHVDYIAAKKMNQKKTSSAVDLKFYHLMSRVRFGFRNAYNKADIYMTVAEIRMSNLIGEGETDFSSGDDIPFIKANPDGVKYPVRLPPEGVKDDRIDYESDETKYTPVVKEGTADKNYDMYLLPQTLSSDVKIEIEIDVWKKKPAPDTDYFKEEHIKLITQLDSSITLEGGKTYQINISYDPPIGLWANAVELWTQVDNDQEI